VLWLELAPGNWAEVVFPPFLFSYFYGGFWAISISFNERRCRTPSNLPLRLRCGSSFRSRRTKKGRRIRHTLHSEVPQLGVYSSERRFGNLLPFDSGQSKHSDFTRASECHTDVTRDLDTCDPIHLSSKSMTWHIKEWTRSLLHAFGRPQLVPCAPSPRS